jgi:medium-chain acyl-[acyl-carrier-protein] hydrolase
MMSFLVMHKSTCQWASFDDQNKPFTLYCFPFAGGAANYFRAWALMSKNTSVKLKGLALPGRGGRLKMPLYESYHQLLRDVVGQLEQDGDAFQECAFFGYSFGALLAYDVMVHCKKNKIRSPRMLFTAGMRAPHKVCSTVRCSDYTDDRLIAMLKKDPDGLMAQHPELIEIQKLSLPALRREHLFFETYQSSGDKIDSPITVFAGTEDSGHAPDRIEAWSELSNESVDVVWLPGHHMFVNRHFNTVFKKIMNDLAPFL